MRQHFELGQIFAEQQSGAELALIKSGSRFELPLEPSARRKGQLASVCKHGDGLLNPIILVGVLALLGGLLVLVELWQQQIARLHRERVVADIRDAQARGKQSPHRPASSDRRPGLHRLR